MSPAWWSELVSLIEQNYSKYDGFVILHGSDTMAYTASAMSLMMENLDKHVILTGSQLPIGTLRTDGKENLITAIEIAAAHENDRPVVPEVAIYFEYTLFRGNRARKVDADHFRAFETLNYPLLAEAGVAIKYNYDDLSKGSAGKQLKTYKRMSQDVAVLKFFPGISKSLVQAVCHTAGLKGLVIETFGSGNAPKDNDILNILEDAINRGVAVLNVSQCHGGSVRHGKYQNSLRLAELGVVSGGDMTSEAAITKLMFLLANFESPEFIKQSLAKSLRGEMTES
jgi:L-asparaginase